MWVYVSILVCWKPCIHTSISIVTLHGSFQCFPSCLRLPSLTVRKLPPFSTKYLIDSISVLLSLLTPHSDSDTPGPHPLPPPPPQYPSLRTGWAAEALPPTPAFLSSACCFYKKCFSFPKCLCFHPLCLSTLVAACVFATRWWSWPGEQALQVCTGEWVEGAVVDTVRGAFGAPRRRRGLHLKANRPGLQRSVAGGWSCDPSDGVGTASVVRGRRLSLPTGWLLSLLSLPVCELFWNRFNESWWT